MSFIEFYFNKCQYFYLSCFAQICTALSPVITDTPPPPLHPPPPPWISEVSLILSLKQPSESTPADMNLSTCSEMLQFRSPPQSCLHECTFCLLQHHLQTVPTASPNKPTNQQTALYLPLRRDQVSDLESVYKKISLQENFLSLLL